MTWEIDTPSRSFAAFAGDFRSFVCLGSANGAGEDSPTQAPRFNFLPVLWTSMIPWTQIPAECREHRRARTRLFPMGPIPGVMPALKGDALITHGFRAAGP